MVLNLISKLCGAALLRAPSDHERREGGATDADFRMKCS
jgi:hypothetical protein